MNTYQVIFGKYLQGVMSISFYQGYFEKALILLMM
jgi:hypothetical protein